jgi:hypothetical protein
MLPLSMGRKLSLFFPALEAQIVGGMSIWRENSGLLHLAAESSARQSARNFACANPFFNRDCFFLQAS